MRLRYAIPLCLIFSAGLLVVRSYLSGQPEQGGTVQPKEPAPIERKSEVPAAQFGEHRAPPLSDHDKTPLRSPALAGEGQGAAAEVLPPIEYLRREYANVLRELELTEADVQELVENFTMPDQHAGGYAGDAAGGFPALAPMPQDLALELEKALVESGVAPEEARIAAVDLLEQMVDAFARYEAGPTSPHVSSPDGSPAPADEAESGPDSSGKLQ